MLGTMMSASPPPCDAPTVPAVQPALRPADLADSRELASCSLHVACLCAAWCRLCEGYREIFDTTAAQLREQWPALRAHWIDIEDEADLVGDYDVPTFPTLLVVDARRVLFVGALPPQPHTLMRVLQSTLTGATATDTSGAPAAAPEVLAMAERLRQRAG